MSSFDEELNSIINMQLDIIANRCKEILEEEIDRDLYDKYIPKYYKRTYQLRNNVRTDIRNGILYVYINTGNTNYKAGNGENVNNKIPYYLNYGHNSNYDEKFMFYQYPSRSFMEKAKERIQKELNLEIEIIENIFN